MVSSSQLLVLQENISPPLLCDQNLTVEAGGRTKMKRAKSRADAMTTAVGVERLQSKLVNRQNARDMAKYNVYK